MNRTLTMHGRGSSGQRGEAAVRGFKLGKDKLFSHLAATGDVRRCAHGASAGGLRFCYQHRPLRLEQWRAAGKEGVGRRKEPGGRLKGRTAPQRRTQLHVDPLEWSDVFPNAACVVSLVDRLMHRAEVIAVEGESYRLKEARERNEERAQQRNGKKTAGAGVRT